MYFMDIYNIYQLKLSYLRDITVYLTEMFQFISDSDILILLYLINSNTHKYMIQ